MNARLGSRGATALGLLSLALLVGCQPNDATSSGSSEPSPSSCSSDSSSEEAVEALDAAPTATELTSPSPAAMPSVSPTARKVAAAAALLFPAPGGDGDSWKDRQGGEYRMGLINTPEYNECYGSAATAKRQSMTANGFRAKVYSTDKYGRRVAVTFTASGINLNVYLAR